MPSSCGEAREKDGGEHQQRGRSDEGGRENERIRNCRGERGRVSRSVRLSVRLFFLSSTFYHSSPLSRRGLITACHCCHGNSRSVKNSSALTPIVRLKFHNERVYVVQPGPKRLDKYLQHDVSRPMKCIQVGSMARR